MTPGARVAAAIEILDEIEAGQAAELALTRWARASRYAGSGDRAAVRDHVYDALRHWRSDAVRGGGVTGRARMIGRLRAQDGDLAMFDGVGHAPPALTEDETSHHAQPEAEGDLWDLPDWLVDAFKTSLGGKAQQTAAALTKRAPITLRVNTRRTEVAAAQMNLLGEGVETVVNPRALTALTVTAGARRLRNAPSYLNGLVELQDAASQAAVLGVAGQGSALDYCAGGGGKALALAACGWDVTAHDIDTSRMTDVPARARRGQHDVRVIAPADLDPASRFDLVFCDAPCSGSGTWRRTPEAKWALTPDRLAALIDMQSDVLDSAVRHVRPGGQLVYATCSVLQAENSDQIKSFLSRHPEWDVRHTQSWDVDAWGDGFFVAHLTRA